MRLLINFLWRSDESTYRKSELGSPGLYKLLFVTVSLFISWQSHSQTQIKYPNYWSKQRQYIYHAVYSDSAGQKITSERVTMSPTENIWEIDARQTLMNFQLDSLSAEWSKIPVEPLNGIAASWTTNFEEGVLQTSNKVWMHPLRRNQYILTELAPFPEIVLPVKDNTTWKSTLWIYKAFGTFEGTVECVYTILEQEERTYNFGKLNCWKIVAVGIHDKLGINSVIYYFNEEYGFTEMNYSFFNKQKIDITLLNLKK